jgi:hypothetical protein
MLCGAATVLGQNLITNPGFESGGTGWTLFTQGGSVAVGAVTYPSTGARTGTRYARVEVTQAAASAGENWHIQFQPPTGWTAGIGTTYEFKFWGKSDSGRNIHVSVQGSDYTYITGQSFGLTTDWAEYSLTHVAEAEGANAVRFHVYVAESKGVYSFDDFTITGTAPAGISQGLETKGQALRVRQQSGNLVLSLGAGSFEAWRAELFDLRGMRLASATGPAGGSLRLALPRKAGAYFIRAHTPTHSWVRKVSVL